MKSTLEQIARIADVLVEKLNSQTRPGQVAYIGKTDAAHIVSHIYQLAQNAMVKMEPYYQNQKTEYDS